MTIKINIGKPEIDLEIMGMNFVYDYSDESMERFEAERSAILEEMRDLNKKPDGEKTTKELKNIVRRGFNSYLGEGTFEKLYEKMPSSLQLAGVFKQVVEAVEAELDKRGIKQDDKNEKLQNYLANKNK